LEHFLGEKNESVRTAEFNTYNSGTGSEGHTNFEARADHDKRVSGRLK
jgi:hypothetical protein